VQSGIRWSVTSTSKGRASVVSSAIPRSGERFEAVVGLLA
jgi:hypothetical protein